MFDYSFIVFNFFIKFKVLKVKFFWNVVKIYIFSDYVVGRLKIFLKVIFYNKRGINVMKRNMFKGIKKRRMF